MNEPLWMPKGSVRGLLALGGLAVTASLMGYGLVANGDAAGAIPESWWPILSGIVTFYFIKSQNAK